MSAAVFCRSVAHLNFTEFSLPKGCLCESLEESAESVINTGYCSSQEEGRQINFPFMQSKWGKNASVSTSEYFQTLFQLSWNALQCSKIVLSECSHVLHKVVSFWLIPRWAPHALLLYFSIGHYLGS